MIKFKTFLESTYKYENPDSKVNLLFDFYMLSYLNHVVTKDHHRINEDEISLVQDAYKTNIDILTKHMLEGVYYGIVREMRHLEEKMSKLNWHQNIEGSLSQTKVNRNTSHYYKIFNQFRNIVSKNMDFFEDEPMKFTRFLKRKLKQQGISSIDFVDMAEYVFTHGDWDDMYGGRLWADICGGWKKLYYSKTYKDKAVYIDHLYDLQHNSGSVLDKMQDYSPSWLAAALDFKRDIHNFKDIIPYISPHLKKHSLRILQKIGHIDPSPPRKTSSSIEVQRDIYYDYLTKRHLTTINDRQPVVEGSSYYEIWKPTKQSEIYKVIKNLLLDLINYIVENDIEYAGRSWSGNIPRVYSVSEKDYKRFIRILDDLESSITLLIKKTKNNFHIDITCDITSKLHDAKIGHIIYIVGGHKLLGYGLSGENPFTPLTHFSSISLKKGDTSPSKLVIDNYEYYIMKIDRLNKFQ